MAEVIDVHTHMLSHQWLAAIQEFGKPQFEVKLDGKDLGIIALDEAPYFTLLPSMFDWDLRIASMNAARVDMAIVSLTTPSVYWGGKEVSLKAAKIINDDFAAAQRQFPERIRWFATLPWQYPDVAVSELTRAKENGAVGVMVIANIVGQHLTDPLFEPIWKEIDRLALPVLVHPAAPPGVKSLGMEKYRLAPAIGFPFDTTLAVGRMIFDGFFDRHQHLKIIACHGGGALPFLIGRLNMCWESMPDSREQIKQPPSDIIKRIYCDAVVYRQDALEMAVSVFGPENVFYGSDYPHVGGDMPGCLARVDALPGETAKRVRSLNAKKIFSL